MTVMDGAMARAPQVTALDPSSVYVPHAHGLRACMDHIERWCDGAVLLWGCLGSSRHGAKRGPMLAERAASGGGFVDPWTSFAKLHDVVFITHRLELYLVPGQRVELAFEDAADADHVRRVHGV